MGDMRILNDQLELGVPIESAMLLAGFSFEDIENREDDTEISNLIKMSEAVFTSKHLAYINAEADTNPRLSQWLLERRVPKDFSPTQTIKEPDRPPNFSIQLVGVKPGEVDK